MWIWVEFLNLKGKLTESAIKANKAADEEYTTILYQYLLAKYRKKFYIITSE